MIELKGLTKRYGTFTAVNAISLEIPRGTLYGLLGPNGAGKTTTMRMIAGILRPTSGSATVAGFDVVSQPLQAKQRLGGTSKWPGIGLPQSMHVLVPQGRGAFVTEGSSVRTHGGASVEELFVPFVKVSKSP